MAPSTLPRGRLAGSLLLLLLAVLVLAIAGAPRAGAARTLLDAGAPSLQDWVDSVTQDALKRAGTQGVTIGGGGAPAYRASSALPTQQQQQQQGAAADDDEEALPLDSTTTTTTQQAPSSSSSSASPARMPTVASAARTPSTGGQASGKISGNDPLQLTNAYRAVHHAAPLAWDDKLAASAKAWADSLASRCQFYHSTTGENLASGYTSWEAVVFAWYDEQRHYNYGAPGYLSATGHFTQLVWKDTARVGCGQSAANCWQGVVWACHYDPPGNVNAPQYFSANVQAP